MTDSDFTSIKPVENLHSIQNVAPAHQQQERKRRQKPSEQQKEPSGKSQNQTPREQAAERNDDPHEIDYRA